MLQNLQTIIDLVSNNNNFSEEDKAKIIASVKEADKKITITEFKLDRTEKVKRTTAILLEETIEELEQKRKAVEAQNRALEIEAALERVRAVALGMKEPADMLEICSTISQQLEALHVKEIRNVQTAIFYEDKDTYMNYEYYAKHNKPIITETSFTNHKMHREFANKMLKGKGEFFTTYISKAELPDWIAYQKTTNVFIDDYLNSASSLNYYWYSLGPVALGISTYEPLREEDINLFKRFLKVFELSYTRYLDIEQAIAQAREAEIELGLERVRARAMAMQTSEELNALIGTVFTELTKLDLVLTRCVILIYEGNEKGVRWWMANSETPSTPMNFFVKYADMPFFNEYLKGWYYRELKWQYCLENENKIKTDGFLFTETELSLLPDFVIEGMKVPHRVYLNASFNNFGNLTLATLEPLSEEHFNILLRFAKVFDLTYTRFNDLKQAEAQARESQIQLALERVRARTMAMQHSDELSETASEMFRQIQLLGLKTWSCGFNIIDKEKHQIKQWVSTGDGRILPSFVTPSDEDVFQRFTRVAQKDKFLYVEEMGGEALKAHYQYMASLPEVKKLLNEFQSLEITPPDFQVFHLASFSYGYLMFITYQPAPEFYDVFKRFATVFDQTYTRFLDLQKAEVQARESQIQLALERVRARTMAMQKSDELADASLVLDGQVRALGIKTRGCAFNIYGDNESLEWFSSEQGSLPMYKTPREKFFLSYFEKGLSEIPLYIEEFAGDACAAHYEYLCTIPIMGDALRAMIAAGGSFPTRQIDHVTYHKYGYLLFITLEPEPEAHDIFIRFAKVFEQTYTRFLDLQKSEGQAREAQIEAALERVRSRTLAMQKSDELAETSAVLFKQLISLGIEPNRLYISIMKADEGESEFWITDEDGTKVSAAYSDNLNANASFKKMYGGWKAGKQSMIIDMKGKELEDYFQHLTSLGVPFKDGLKQKRRIQHLAFFNHGFIGMAAPDDQPEETIHLLERFAAVFNLTFTRFNDLKLAEAHAVQAEEDLIKLQTEKKRAEDALIELRTAQKQLVQSEKMASLGELTAGIAHEIQNPLNFVNNFSEVSKELLDEMTAALESGDQDEARELVKDVILNLEKINHHGRRADAIVKGMLQHSRKSSEQKELTDINALCDEYLRLSYHGLRAKDKIFNADFKTDFDESIGKINIIPQDIGRVLLNLFNNAFYAVNEKKKLLANSYQPLAEVKTRRINGSVQITVTDNGSGIPSSIKEKIFQPFFTTKPTGQGTGLGLSLAYDIIKAHGGEIKLEAKENEETRFIITLPYK